MLAASCAVGVNVSCVPSADNAAEPGTAVPPCFSVIVQPLDWTPSAKAIRGVASAGTPVAPSAGVLEVTVTTLGSASKTTSTQ